MSLSEGALDFADGPSTYGYLTAGNPVTGTNSSTVDGDGFSVYLQAGVTYFFYINGVSYPSGVDNNLAYLNLYSPSGAFVGQSSGSGSETLTFTATVSGLYGASVQSGGGVGSYFLSYDPLSITDDFGADFTSSPSLVGSGPTFGQLEYAGDSDGFQIETTAGQRYYYEYYTSVPDLYVKVQNWSYDGLPGVVVSGGGSGSFVASSSDNVLLLVSSNSFTTTGSYYIYAAQTFTTTANLVVGGALSEVLLGTAGSDEMHGSWGQDSLSGGAGGDYLFGGPSVEADTLNGGAGVDRLAGGKGNDTYIVDVASDLVVELASEGTDTVLSSASFSLGSNVERLTLSGTGTINGTGNTLANTITGNGAANSLNGSSGNDTLSGGAGNDTLTGGLGIDSMVGGTGNDTYSVDSLTDRVTETSTLVAEIDTVVSSVTWTLGSNVERLTLSGTGTINGTGNTLANTITGNAGVNVLNGGSGNDTINGAAGNDTVAGGLGNDSLTGGVGVDTFLFNTTRSATTNVDRITDFTAVDDRLLLDDAVFAGIGPVGQIAAANFRLGAAAGDASDRVIYNSATGQLFFDADGNGTGAAMLFATVAAGTTITAADIWIG
jgi:Ca2+-binding RTX toxin-like protein